MYIYKIENKINNKMYIGQTINKPENRWKRHQRISQDVNSKDFSYIHSAISKYGVENFSFDVIDKANNKEELDAKEKKYISELNTLVPNGYNISSGGQFTKEIDEQTRKKISESKKGENNPNWGKIYTKEEREAHRQMMLKRYSDPNERIKTGIKNREVWSRPGYREKMSEIRKNNATDEFRKKVGEASKKVWENENFRKIMSEKRKAQWADPIKREKMMRKRMETRKNNPEGNKKIASRWKDPEFRKKWMLARHKKIVD